MKDKVVTYYQKLSCYAFYRDGNQQRIDRGAELIMTGFFDNGLICISQTEFKLGDVLILNIHIDRYPYEKLMCHVRSVKRFGDMDALEMEIMGIPNSLHEKMKAALEHAPSVNFAINLNEQEKLLLKRILEALNTSN